MILTAFFRNIALILLVICAGCVSTSQEAEMLWNHPLPTPEFIVRIHEPEAMRSGAYDLCVEVAEHYLFEPGNEGDDIYRNLQETIRLTVDGEAIEDIRILSDLLLLGQYDETGAYLGSHGGDDYICIQSSRFAAGLHLVILELESTAGKKFTHRWAFQIP
ncbi:MAG: hypothetical protein H6672_03780 [Anaerolineaceae bacterium]|nr:hypothetical protein [Anaerolineaceae bacterium]